MERMEECLEKKSNGIRTELYWSHSFCVLFQPKDDLQRRITEANHAARVGDKSAILESAPPCFSLSKREIAHASVSTHAPQS